MAEPITLDKLRDASVDADTLGEFANEDKTVTSRKGLEYPSAPMASRLVVESGLLGATPFATAASMGASLLANGDYAIVTDDNDLEKNGYWQKQSGVWKLLKWNPINQFKDYVNANPLFKPQRLEPITNIDTLFAAGVYHVPLNSTAIALNLPTGVYGQVYVSGNTRADNSGYVFQTYINTNGNVYQRVYSGSSWSKWKGSDIQGSNIDSADDAVVVVTDSENNQTWLQASRKDGGLTDVAAQAIRDKLGMDVDTTTKPSIHPHQLPTITGSQTSIKAADTYFKNGEVLPFMPDVNKVLLTGSSSMERSVGYITTALKTINPAIEIYAPAFGGAVVEHQMTAIGSEPVLVNFADNKILASTEKQTVTLTGGFRFNPKLGDVEGWIDGIEGTLSAVGSVYSFERKVAASSSTTLSGGTAFIPKLGNEYRNAVFVIWIGKNNVASTFSSVNDVDSLIAHTHKIIEFNASLVKRFVVMTHFNNRDTPEVSEVRDKLDRCNRLYKLHYKQNVFDVEPIILGTQIFTDLGITRTADDIAKQAIRNMPPSLAADDVHLKPEVYEYIAGKLADFIDSKNFLEV